MSLQEMISKELEKLERGIVATPKTRKNLDAFARANNGSNDVLLTQLAVNYGYKIALLNIQESLKESK